MRARATFAALAVLACATLVPAPTQADVALISTGGAGTVELLTFAGEKESWPTDSTDAGQASVECEPLTRGRRAVFAGALAWAADEHPGMGDDWRYVRVTAGAADEVGAVVTGETSPFYPAYDDRPAALPAVSVILPDGDATYTPVLTVQFFDATYELVGASVVAGQVGAWRRDDGWLVEPADLVRCS
jgi:hypothetical protein